jgi:hypothetical protein
MQKRFRLEGAVWYMARSTRAAMMVAYLAGVEFRRPWEPPPLEPWERPFANPNQQLPQAPDVAAQRREAQRRSRER